MLDVERGGKALGTVAAGKNAYTAERQVSNEVGIRSDLVTGEDLFVIAEQVNADGSVYVPRLREAARQPDLARRLDLPARGADHALARRPRAAAPRRALRRRRALACGRERSRSSSARSSRRRASSSSRCRTCASRQPELDALDDRGELEQRQLELAEVRDRALGALKELEFDHRTGKVSDEDYRALVGPLRREAAEALRALEPRAGATARVKAERPG